MLRLVFIYLLIKSGALLALPEATAEFCEVYPDSPHCQAGSVDCSFCHTSAPSLAPFGRCIKDELQGPLVQDLASTLASLEGGDCDGDGFSNLKEILFGTYPGDAKSKPKSSEPSPPTQGLEPVTCA